MSAEARVPIPFFFLKRINNTERERTLIDLKGAGIAFVSCVIVLRPKHGISDLYEGGNVFE